MKVYWSDRRDSFIKVYWIDRRDNFMRVYTDRSESNGKKNVRPEAKR